MLTRKLLTARRLCGFFWLSAAFLGLSLPGSSYAQSSSGQSLYGQVQDPQPVKPVPLLQGSAGFLTTFDGGDPHLGPIVVPVVLVPISQRWLVEARATFDSDLAPQPGLTGFHGQLRKEVDYAQLDFIANPYLTVTVGRFLTPCRFCDLGSVRRPPIAPTTV